MSRFLVEQALKDWHGNCDGIYLFGNDSVKDFYPRLGFASAPEYQCSRKAPTSNLNIKIDQLNMEEMPDLQLLKMKSADFNPYSLFSAENNEWLVLFYSTLFFKDKFFWHIPQYDTIVVAGFEGDRMNCYDIFGAGDIPYTTLFYMTKHPNRCNENPLMFPVLSRA
ncbi:GNAT family acetyltransferase [Paenibacillus polymyxa]|nr:GNAT family acetyltransferase [Paenibacillus polymyxa]